MIFSGNSSTNQGQGISGPLQRCAGVVQEYRTGNNKYREIIPSSAIQTMSVGGEQREAREKNQRIGRAPDNI